MATAVEPTTRSKLGSVLKGRKKVPSVDNSDREETSSTTTSDRRDSLEGGFGNSRLDRSRPPSRRSSESSNRNNKLSALLKRRRRKGTEVSLTVHDGGLGQIPTGHSSVNDLGIEDNASGSLLTEDSEEQRPIRPSLSPHLSHTGYLTLSSPLIPVESVDSNTQPVPPVPDFPTSNPPLTKSQTLEAPASSVRRSPSPVGRFREALASTKKLSSGKGKDSQNPPRTTGNGEGGGGLSVLLPRGRGGSTSSRRESQAAQDQSLSPAPVEKVQPSKRPPAPNPIVTQPPTTPPRDFLDGPTTVVTPPTPTGPREEDQNTPTPTGKPDIASDSKQPSDPARAESPPILSHTRTTSASNVPSKLSHAIAPPLTPALEETKTPGGTLVAPSATSGFFSSMFSAAQNAATSLTNTITSTTSGQRGKSATGTPADSEQTREAGEEEVILDSTIEQNSAQGEKRRLAVETLGSGDLSLSHLGITEPIDSSQMTSKVDGVEASQPSATRRDEAWAKAEDDAVARAVSSAYSEKNNGEKSKAPSVVSVPSDQAKPAQTEDQTPIKSSIEPESSSIKRAGSVRSRLSGSRRRRTRGSSGGTGTTTATLQPNGPQRPQGFAVANQKRNRDFHNLFKSVPDDDLLIEDYSAALQREILLQGRLYVSEGHICFSSNILGWVTNLVISFDEVISVEKKSTAVIFQNGIVISTMHARNVFASLLNRDTTYELIISMWKITHPNLKSTLNGNAVEGGGTGDKTEKADSVVDGDSASEELYDEEETTDGDGEIGKSMDGIADDSASGSDAGDGVKTLSRKTSAAVVGVPLSNGTAKALDSLDTAITGAAASVDFPGPSLHDVTDCGDQASHYEKLLLDITIPAPLGKIYSMMFGPASGAFMRKWLIEDQKSTDLQLEDDKKGLGPEKKTMSYSYIKPLNGSIGPKQTKCIIAQTLEQYDLEKAVTIACSTQNPDVPSGNIFVVKTRYCLMWGPSNSTRLVITYAIEWSGKSWLKGPIEKGANDGQLQYAKDLVASLKAAVMAKSILKNGAKGKIRGTKRRREANDTANAPTEVDIDGVSGTKSGQKNWGILEPLRGPLEPLAGVLANPIVAIGLLLTVIVYLLWKQSRTPYTGYHGVDPYRSASYERIWASEENELWTWLEERIGLEDSRPTILRPDSEEKGKRAHMFDQNTKDMQRKLSNENMNERQVIEAIEVTRRRLEVLEAAVRRKHPVSNTKPAGAQEVGEEFSVRTYATDSGVSLKN